MAAFLIVDERDLVFLFPVQAVGKLGNLFLPFEKFINLRMHISSAGLVLVKPPGVNVIRQHPGEVSFQRYDTVTHVIESHGIPIKSIFKMGPAILLRHEHLAAEPEGILHLTLSHAAAGLPVVVNARSRQEIHSSTVQNRQSSRSCRAVEEIRTAIGTVEGSHDFSLIALF